MITEVIAIDIDLPNLDDDSALAEAWRFFDTQGDRFPTIEKYETDSPSHKSETEISFWAPDINHDIQNE